MSKAQLQQAMSGHFMRRTKSEVLADLPAIMIRDLRLELGSSQRRAYNEVWANRYDSVNVSDRRQATMNMLAILTRLKQLCNYDAESGDSIKLEAIRGILETIKTNGEKVLIFSQYVQSSNGYHLELPFLIDSFMGD